MSSQPCNSHKSVAPWGQCVYETFPIAGHDRVARIAVFKVTIHGRYYLVAGEKTTKRVKLSRTCIISTIRIITILTRSGFFSTLFLSRPFFVPDYRHCVSTMQDIFRECVMNFSRRPSSPFIRKKVRRILKTQTVVFNIIRRIVTMAINYSQWFVKMFLWRWTNWDIIEIKCNEYSRNVWVRYSKLKNDYTVILKFTKKKRIIRSDWFISYF